MRPRILGLLLGLLVLAVIGAAWLLPGQIDSERFRAPLKGLASRTLGMPVAIDGPIRVSLLPHPTLETGSLDVIAASGARLQAHGLRLRLGLLPLLAGRLSARSLWLYRPTLALPGPFDPRLLLLHRATWLGAAALRVTEGRLIAGDLRLRALDAAIAADPLTGDVHATGDVALPDGAWRFDTRLSQPGGDGAAAVALSLDGQAALRGTSLTLSGQLAADGTLQGHGSAHGPDLSRLLPTPPLAFAAEGRVSLGAGLAEADDLAVQLDGVPAHAAVALRLPPSQPRLDLALTTDRLDLAPWLAMLLRGPSTPTMPAGIDLSAEAARLGDGDLRGLRAGFDLAGGTARLREFHAGAPGDATLDLLGQVHAGRFVGDVRLRAPDWQTTQRWLLPLLPAGLPALPATGLQLSADVTADRREVSLGKLAGTLDRTGIGGTLGWQSGTNPPLLTGQLRVDTLDLDAWSGIAMPATTDFALDLTAGHVGLHGATLPTTSVAVARRGGAWTLARLVSAGPALAVTASGRLSADGRLDAARVVLTMKRAATLTSLPWAAALPTPRDASLLAQPVRLIVDASGSRDALSLSVDGRLGDAALSASPTVDTTSGAWHGPLRLQAPSARAVLEATGLLTRTGLPPDAGWIGAGSLALSADAGGDAKTLSLDHLSLTAGGLRLVGALHLGWDGSPSLSGRIDAASLPLPAWSDLVAAGLDAGRPTATARLTVHADRLGIGGLPPVAPFGADLSLADGQLAVQHLTATLDGGTLLGQAALDLAATPPRLTVAGSMQGMAIGAGLLGTPVDVTAGRLSGEASLSGSGYSAAAVSASLQGDAALQVDDGLIEGVALGGLAADLPAAAVAAALQGGRTPFDRLDVALRVRRGVATIEGGGASLASGRLDLAGSDDLVRAALDLTLEFRPRGPSAPPSVGLRLLGPVGSVQRVPQLAALAQWRAARDGP